MEILRPIIILFIAMFPCISSCFTSLGCEIGGDLCLARVARDFAMGGTHSLQFAIENPILEASFCITHHQDSSQEGDDSFSLWSIPNISFSFPFKGSVIQFSRDCVYDYNYRLTDSTGILISSGEIWSNSIRWKDWLTTRIFVELQTGILMGEVVEGCGMVPYLYLRREKLIGGILSVLLLYNTGGYSTYGGIRYYQNSKRPSEIWLGVNREIAGIVSRLEVARRPSSFQNRQASIFPELSIGLEEKIRENLRLRYGLTTELSPVLFCFTFGFGIYNSPLNVDTSIGYHLFETERMIQLITTLSVEL